MSFKLLIALTFVLGLVHATGSAPKKLELIGTLRDFSNWDSKQPQAHPDFNRLNGAETDIVKHTLGVDGKPVFNTDKVPKVTQVESKESFDQWYRTTENVNIEFPYTLVLTDNGNGIYTYDNPAFFPLDGKGFGNDNNGHNYGFTYEVHTVFTYQEGQKFYFRGDDDLWVFINKDLVIDLGGIHGAMEGSVELDDLDLTPGEDYTLDIFFAERHVWESNFKIQTSIQLKPSCSPPQIYNPVTNKCQDCPSNQVYLASTGKCGAECEAPKIYNPNTFACEECPAPFVYDSNAKGGCGLCPEGKLYLKASKSCGVCEGPKIYDPVAYTCDYCPGFYNYDGTCVVECPQKLQVKVEGTTLCNFPCPRKTQIYQADQDRCRCTCPEPYTLTVSAAGYQLCTIIQLPL